MTGQNWKRYLPALVVALLVALAYSLRYVYLPGPPGVFLGLARPGVYIGLYIAWGISVSRRIIRPETRRLFIAIAVLMVFWLTVRTAKFEFLHGALGRYCWYLYYAPMLLIPLLTTLITAFLGRPEGYRLPAWTRWLYLAAAALLLLVLTNDLHQLVFVFPAGKPYSDLDYSYGAGFIPVAVWRYGGLLATLIMVFVRSRLPGRGKRLLVPLVPAALLVLYHLIYLSEAPWLRDVFGDLTAAECLLVVCILECCLGTGLIPCNTGYDRLMRACGVPVVIVDGEYRGIIASGSYTPLPVETLRRAESGSVELSGGMRLSSAPLRTGGGGRVLWEEDVAELTRQRRDLEAAREQISKRNALEAETYRLLRQKQDLMEKNRLYDLMRRQTATRVAQLDRLLDRLDETEEPAEEDRLLVRMSVLGAYIKRRSNLVFLSEGQSVLPAAELKNCMDETLRGLSLFDVEADLAFSLRSEMAYDQMIRFYDAFQTIVERALDSLTELLAAVSEKDGAPVMSLRLCCDEDLTALTLDGLAVSREDEGEWLIGYAPREGGGAA